MDRRFHANSNVRYSEIYTTFIQPFKNFLCHSLSKSLNTSLTFKRVAHAIIVSNTNSFWIAASVYLTTSDLAVCYCYSSMPNNWIEIYALNGNIFRWFEQCFWIIWWIKFHLYAKESNGAWLINLFSLFHFLSWVKRTLFAMAAY